MDMDYVRNPAVGKCRFKGGKGEEGKGESRPGIQTGRVNIAVSEKTGVLEKVDRYTSDSGCGNAAAPCPPLQGDAYLDRASIDLCPALPEASGNTGPHGSKDPCVHAEAPERRRERARNIGKASNFGDGSHLRRDVQNRDSGAGFSVRADRLPGMSRLCCCYFTGIKGSLPVYKEEEASSYNSL